MSELQVQSFNLKDLDEKRERLPTGPGRRLPYPAAEGSQRHTTCVRVEQPPSREASDRRRPASAVHLLAVAVTVKDRKLTMTMPPPPPAPHAAEKTQGVARLWSGTSSGKRLVL